MGIFTDPYNPDSKLWSVCPCGQHDSLDAHQRSLSAKDQPQATSNSADWSDQESVLARCVESAILKGLFKTDAKRRQFMRAVGAGTASAAIASIIPMD